MLEVVNLFKTFPGTVALDDVSIRFEDGQVHALLGKNGAGKSTLVRILAGATQPSAGEIRIDGQPFRFTSPAQAFHHGIVTVHQELSLVPGLTVAENILLGRLPKRRLAGFSAINWTAAHKQAAALLQEMDVQIPVTARAGELSVAQQQVVEIAKAMSFRPRALLLDEPTSALAHHETESLFRLVRQLASRGVAIVYITHRLQELRNIADVITVLRDGKVAGTAPIADATPETIANMMFGQAVHKHRPANVTAGTGVALEVRHLTRRPWFDNVSFSLARGEILGIAGMLGSGRTELLKAIFGAEPAHSGEVIVEGTPRLRPASPAQMKRLGIAFTPENRKQEGLVQILSTRANMCMAAMSQIASGGHLTKRRERTVAQQFVAQLQIKVADLEQSIGELSGGNQQKVVIAKWLGTQPRVVLFDEPTRGIDVQAKQQIFQVMWNLSRAGIGSIFVSSELEELVEVCHRILIMQRGRITREVSPADTTTDQLFVRCLGEEKAA